MVSNLSESFSHRAHGPHAHRFPNRQVYNYQARFTEARAELARWVSENRLKVWATEYEGIDKAPQAFVDMLGGVTAGTTVVKF